MKTGVEIIGDIAQLGERLPCKQEVAGSIPTISTIAYPRPNSIFKPMNCLKIEEEMQRNERAFAVKRKRGIWSLHRRGPVAQLARACD